MPYVLDWVRASAPTTACHPEIDLLELQPNGPVYGVFQALDGTFRLRERFPLTGQWITVSYHVSGACARASAENLVMRAELASLGGGR